MTTAVCFALAVAACGGEDTPTPESDATSADTMAAEPTKVGEITGLNVPESALHDATRDVWYITNINGVPNDKDGNGFITRVSGDLINVDTQFIAGGVNGVTLNAPKGMALIGDTLWVADIDAVRAFNVVTGAGVATVDVPGAVFLNDIAVGPDGVLYISDTGIRFGSDGMTHPGPDRLFRLDRRAVGEILRFEGQPGPNGLFTDNSGRMIVAPFAATTIFAWTPGTTAADSIASGPGGYDGIAQLGDGRMLVSSWTDSTVHVLADGALTPLLRGLPSPADIGVDAGRGYVAVPLFESGRVEFWTAGMR